MRLYGLSGIERTTAASAHHTIETCSGPCLESAAICMKEKVMKLSNIEDRLEATVNAGIISRGDLAENALRGAGLCA